MKTKDEILRAMRLCTDANGKCRDCPYQGDERVGEDDEIFSCGEAMMRDAITLIEMQG